MPLNHLLKSKIKFASILILGLSLGYVSSKVLKSQSDPWGSATTVARKDYAKRVVASDPKVALTMGKHLSLVHINLSTAAEIPASEDQEVKLIASVKLLQSISSDLQYKWILPEGVEVVQGHVQDSFANIGVGQLATAELTVVGFSKQKMQNVVFEASVEELGSKLGSTQILTSRPEDTQEALAPLRQQAVENQKE